MLPSPSQPPTPSARRPFRLKLAPVTDPATRALLHDARARKAIDEWVRMGCLAPCPRPLLSYADAISRVDHPHEAVAVDLVRSRCYKFSDEVSDAEADRAHQEVWTRLLLRAAEQAATEGVHWPPLLDAMAERIRHRRCHLDSVLQPLLEWIDHQHDPRRIRPLTHARYHVLRHEATLRLFQLSPELPTAESLVDDRRLFFVLYDIAALQNGCYQRLAKTAIDLVLGDLSPIRRLPGPCDPCGPCDEQDGQQML